MEPFNARREHLAAVALEGGGRGEPERLGVDKDGKPATPCASARRGDEVPPCHVGGARCTGNAPVSYTHLTLPTICSV
eukprot:3206883-Alexandrium_andersonii.AAC.1